MRRINLWGLPCSGTTIVVRYFHSLPRSYFMSEPLAEIRTKGYANPFVGKKTIDEIFDGMDVDLGGFKECFHSEHILETEEWKQKKGWEFVPIIRDPFSTWGSLAKRGWGSKSANNITKFLWWLELFMKDIKDRPTIIYEDFSKDPAVEISRAVLVDLPKPTELKKMDRRYGNSKAHQSMVVKPQPIDPITDGDRKMIKESEGYKLYIENLTAQQLNRVPREGEQ